MSHLLKDFRGKIDLIYIDPPFDSKADYKKKIEIRNIRKTDEGRIYGGGLKKIEPKELAKVACDGLRLVLNI